MNQRTVHGIIALALAAPLLAQDTVRPIPLLMPAATSLVVHVKGPVGTLRVHAGDPYGAMLKSAAFKTLGRGLLDQRAALPGSNADSPRDLVAHDRRSTCWSSKKLPNSCTNRRNAG